VAIAFAGVDGRCEEGTSTDAGVTAALLTEADGITAVGAATDVAEDEGPEVGAFPRTNVPGAKVTPGADGAALVGGANATLIGTDDDPAEPADEATLFTESSGTSFVSTSFNVCISIPDDRLAVGTAGTFSCSR
jgi:hypothetical protein